MPEAIPNLAIHGDESYLRSLIRSLPDLLFVIDRHGRFVDYKAEARDLYARPEDFLGHAYSEVLPAEIAGRLRDAIARTTAIGDKVPIEYTIPIGDDTHHFAGTAVAFGDGNVLATIRDVTEQKRMEEGLRNEMALQNLLMTIASKYINTRPGDVAAAIDDSLAEIARFVHADRSYIFDYHWDRGVCSNTHEWCATGISPQREQLQDVSLEWVPQWVETHQKGETMYVPDVLALPEGDGLRAILEPQDIKSLIAIPILDAGRCVGFVGFDSVLTHHRYSERERILLSVFAEILVSIRTRATLEERLVEESQKAQAANRAKSQFLANMSHELRTPLNGVIGMTSLLLDTTLDDEQRMYVETAQSSGEDLLALVNDILDFSKVEAGRLDLELVDFDLAALLDDFTATLSLRAREKGLALACGADPGVPTLLRGDPGRLRQILNNLVGNAIKFTETGTVDVRVTAVSQADDAVQLKFAVRDTGIGVPRDQVERLFEKFTQADASMTRKYGGTGLGLAISKQLTDLMGGEIGVTSEEGQGSEFWFTAWFQRPRHITDGGPGTTGLSSAAACEGFQGSQARLLLVEDNIMNQRVGLLLLKKLGLRADAVANGAEAVQALESIPYDLVLMDVQMPVMDGLEATRRIRSPQSAVRNRDIPIIAMTAHAVHGSRERFLAAGMDGYVSKPITAHALVDVLEPWLRGGLRRQV